MSGTRFADLRTRTLAGLGLGAVALAAVAAGDYWSAALFAVAGGAMAWELRRMTGAGRGAAEWVMIGATMLAVLATEMMRLRWGIAVLGLGALLLLLLERHKTGWQVFGLVYIGLAMSAVDGLRNDPLYGFDAVLWLFLTVIASDVGGYFGGRIVGGPKLWPRVSPKKTWAGTVAGMALAAIVGAFFSRWTTGTLVEEVATVSAVTALMSQAGDIGESAVKRHFRVKDSSRLIPGHGGVLDRLDGLMAAGLFSAVITFARGTSLFIW
ncbi:phosphatidate cytidylyltransferase [Paroceanicella profunda]|uniref:Phosphatidate cytidylyltransferase n=1 Tax=Paroceanicella profunda TaxID=2579971 RepID=A0A5B8G0S4_9RHOB|nr:phosphatidate cytidylyltransferase [Paroceanicella profunda]QDL92739.1 phosphatidate cytidylyltransferase [Paroceanicella profunda]